MIDIYFITQVMHLVIRNHKLVKRIHPRYKRDPLKKEKLENIITHLDDGNSTL